MAEQKLHPDAQKVCDLIVASGRPPFETLSPAEARQAYQASRQVLQPDAEPVAEVAELQAAGPGGPIPLRLYRGQGAAKGSPQPALVYFHGGGWVIGDLKPRPGLPALANAAACIVVAVDYRLAPSTSSRPPSRTHCRPRAGSLATPAGSASMPAPRGRRRQRRRQPRRRRVRSTRATAAARGSRCSC